MPRYWRDKVSRILPTMVDAMMRVPERRFVWAETVWLSYFMATANATMRADMQSLIDSGRLEVIGGGWVMHDEAASSLFAVLNQLAVGFSFLEENFHTRPHYQWHIDPFGHSATTPIVFAGLGYSAFVINRVVILRSLFTSKLLSQSPY